MHPGYLGLTLLALAVVGGRSRWWAVLGAAVVVAPGAELAALGQPLGVSNPFAWLLDQIPMGDLVNHHGRILLIGAVALSVLAARGACRLGRWTPLAVVAVVLDLALLSPAPFPLPVATTDPPAALDPCPVEDTTCTDIDAMSAGRLLVVPIGGPGVHFQRPLFDQRLHERPLVRSPNRPGLTGALTRDPFAKWLASLALPSPAPAPSSPSLPKDVAVLLVMAPHIDTIRKVLGPPDREEPDSALWDLGRISTGLDRNSISDPGPPEGILDR
jgi:hypothetical protein